MKKFILLLAIFFAFSCEFGYAQSYKMQDKTIIQQKSAKSDTSSKDIATKYTFQDLKGNIYPIFLHKYEKGKRAGQWACYVNKVSSKTGKEYKYYINLEEESLKEIVQNTIKE